MRIHDFANWEKCWFFRNFAKCGTRKLKVIYSIETSDNLKNFHVTLLKLLYFWAAYTKQQSSLSDLDRGDIRCGGFGSWWLVGWLLGWGGRLEGRRETWRAPGAAGGAAATVVRARHVIQQAGVLAHGTCGHMQHCGQWTCEKLNTNLFSKTRR